MSKLTAYDWANVRELDVGKTDNPRRRMWEATSADGEVHQLMAGWPLVTGEGETLHCATCGRMNNCEGALRVHLCLVDEAVRTLQNVLREGKLTLLGLQCTGGSYNPGLELELDVSKPLRLVRK